MLALTRKADETIVIDPHGPNPITITVLKIEGAGSRERARVRIGIDAPKDVLIMRRELLEPSSRATD